MFKVRTLYCSMFDVKPPIENLYLVVRIHITVDERGLISPHSKSPFSVLYVTSEPIVIMSRPFLMGEEPVTQMELFCLIVSLSPNPHSVPHLCALNFRAGFDTGGVGAK